MWKHYPDFEPAPRSRIEIGKGGLVAEVFYPAVGSSLRTDLTRSTHAQPDQLQPTGAGLLEINSAPATTLTSSGLAPLKRAWAFSVPQLQRIRAELERVSQQERVVRARHKRWSAGILFRRVFKKKYAKMGVEAALLAEKCEELQAQQALAVPHFDIVLSQSAQRLHDSFLKAFAACASSKKIWDTLTKRAIERSVTRQAASEEVTRKPVTFEMECCPVLDLGSLVPKFNNANGGDIFVFPGFIIYHEADSDYALIGLSELAVSFEDCRFIEDGETPSDSRQVATAWHRANKDGGPDLRFKDNYQRPVMLYGALALRSVEGLNEEYMVSNHEAAKCLALALQDLVKAAQGETR